MRLKTLALTTFFLVAGASAIAEATPKKGDVELRLSPPSFLGFGQGIGYYSVSCEKCDDGPSVFTFSVASGAGYFITDSLEIGAALDFMFGRISVGDESLSGYGIGVGPFVRYLKPLSRRMALAPEVSALFRTFHGSSDDGSSSAESDSLNGVQVTAQIPLEIFFADMWSLRFGPGYQFLRLSGDQVKTTTVHGAVFNWAIATYF
jgi:hypothetical protein